MDKMLSQIVEQSLNEIYIIDFKSKRFLYANEAAIRNIEYSLEELKAMTPFDLKPKVSHPSVLKNFARLDAANIASDKVIFKVLHIRKSGSTYPVEIHLQLIEDKGRLAYIAFALDVSENQRTLNLLKAVTKGASIGYWEWNVQTGECWVSDRWLEIVGYPLSACNNVWDFWVRQVHPDDKHIGEVAMPVAFKNNQPYIIEFRIKHLDGHYVWIEGSGAILEHDTTLKTPIRICGTHLDITQRKENEFQKEQFHTFFKISSGIMLILDTNNIIQRVNPATSQVLGYQEHELVSHSVLNFIHPDDHLATIHSLESANQTGFALEQENRYRCKDGHYIWLSWSGSFDVKDKTIYAMARDVSEHKELLHELHRKEEMYRALAEYSGDAIMRYDKNHRHIYASPAVEILIGIPAHDFINKTHEEMGFPKRLCSLWNKSIQLAFLTKEANSLIFETESSTGKTIVDWRVFPELNSYGQVEAVISVSRDITQSRKAEEELQKMQKLNSLGVLAGGIAHDFNNILTILFGNLTLTKNLIANDHPAYETLHEAEQAFHRATHLTSQLLTFAKGGNPVKKDVSINQLIQDVTQFDLSGSNVKLIFEPKPDTWLVNVDTSQITQVFSNLTTNANQSMPDGGHLYIDISNKKVKKNEVISLPEGHYLKFIVRDEGVGIKQSHINQIFDPYFSTKETGSGLGLATVFSIIKKHHGHISVDSIYNKGTAFTLYLPASKSQNIDNQKTNQHHENTDLCHKKILIMDDEEMILKLATNALESKGYVVESAENGLQAFGMYQNAINSKQPYDCIIMDLTIPGGMGGVDALQKILTVDPTAKAIVSSGYAVDPVMANYKNYGFKAIIAKPFTIASLRNVVQQVVSN